MVISRWYLRRSPICHRRPTLSYFAYTALLRGIYSRARSIVDHERRGAVESHFEGLLPKADRTALCTISGVVDFMIASSFDRHDDLVWNRAHLGRPVIASFHVLA